MREDEIIIDWWVRELSSAANMARLNFEIWWLYKSEKTRPKYIKAMRKYNTFFSASIHAHFVASLMALYRIYETRKDTFNIPRFLKSIKAMGFTPNVVKEAEQILSDVRPLWIKVNILRNKVFGHRTTLNSTVQAFKEAELKP